MFMFKRFYDFFGVLLAGLIITLVAAIIAVIVLYFAIGKLHGHILLYVIRVLFLLLLFASMCYLFTGITRACLLRRRNNDVDRFVNVAPMIKRGVGGILVSILLYFILLTFSKILSHS